MNEVIIDEDIPNYDEVLSHADRKYTLAEEINSRMFGIQTMEQESFDELKHIEIKCGQKFKRLTGIHSYDILRNPAYIEQFQYYSADLPDRDAFIIDDDFNNDNNNAQSDLVKICMCLAYIKPYKLDEINFSADELMKMADDPECTQRTINELWWMII